MADDRIVFNTRERIISNDLNDAQSMQSRRNDDVLRFTSREYRVPTLNPSLNAPTFENWVSGLEVLPVSDTEAQVLPGVLGIEAPSNITQGALDSAMRVGELREAFSVTGLTGANRTLIAARLVETVTEQTSRDVRQPATDTFTSNEVPKKVEFLVEIGIHENVGSDVFPDFNALGDEWEPLAFYWGGAVFDARRQLRDVERAGPSGPVTAVSSERGRPQWVTRNIMSLQDLNSTNTGAGVRGNLEVFHEGRVYRMWSDLEGAVGINGDASVQGETINTGDLLHLYFVPMRSIATGKARSVSQNYQPEGVTRSLIVRSNTVLPNQQGLNSTAFTFATTRFGSYTVAPGDAIHIVTATLRSSSTTVFRPWVMNGNTFRYGGAHIPVQYSDFDDYAPIYGQFTGAATTTSTIANINAYGPFGTYKAGIPQHARAIQFISGPMFTGETDIRLNISNQTPIGPILGDAKYLEASNYISPMIPITPFEGAPLTWLSDLSATATVASSSTFAGALALAGYEV